MNIFITDKCPIKSAKHLDDKRVNKMILESAQMLSTACRLHHFSDPKLYKRTHINHPCSIWARQNKSNYRWLYDHYVALAHEKIKRTGKSHKSFDELQSILREGINYIPDGYLTEFPNCAAREDLGISYKHIKDVCLAYQLYLNDRWDIDTKSPTWYGISK